MNKFKYKLASPVLMWLIVVVGGVVLWNAIPSGMVFSAIGWVGKAILVLAVINWLYVWLSAWRVHRKAATSVDNINQIIDEGVYALVRHPMYASEIALGIAVFIYFPSYKVLAVAIWLALILTFWAKFEERMLEEKFLEDYRQYKKRVPMFIPRFGRR